MVIAGFTSSCRSSMETQEGKEPVKCDIEIKVEELEVGADLEESTESAARLPAASHQLSLQVSK